MGRNAEPARRFGALVRLRIHVEDLFHARREAQYSTFRRHPVFFSVRRTVSWLIDSTIANSTTRRASSRNDQFA